MTTDFAPLDWDIARTITAQATVGSLMSLGATDRFAMETTDTRRGGVTYQVSILPMRKNGTRGTRARRMRLAIELTYADTYRVTVKYATKGGAGPYAIHYQTEGIYCDQLAKLLLALDYDGDTVLNPRVL